MRSNRPSPLSRRVVRLLEAKGIHWPGGEENACIHRTYAGSLQASAGAWAWFLWPVEHDHRIRYPQVGSQFPASQVRADWVVNRDEHGFYVFDPPR